MVDLRHSAARVPTFALGFVGISSCSSATMRDSRSTERTLSFPSVFLSMFIQAIIFAGSMNRYSRPGRRQFPLLRFNFRLRTTSLRTLLGVRRVRGQFADLLADWCPRSAAALQRPMGAGVGRYRSGHAGRAVAIYPLCALFARSRLRIDPRHQHVLFWGGLRGALALALALSLPEELPQREFIVGDHLRRRGFLRVRSRVDDYAAAPMVRTAEVRQVISYSPRGLAKCLILFNVGLDRLRAPPSPSHVH